MHSTNTGSFPAVLIYPSTQALANLRVALSTARAVPVTVISALSAPLWEFHWEAALRA